MDFKTASTVPVTSGENEYRFSDRELVLFRTKLNEMQILAAELNAATSIICIEHGLQGRWQVKADGSGLVRTVESES